MPFYPDPGFKPIPGQPDGGFQPTMSIVAGTEAVVAPVTSGDYFNGLWNLMVALKFNMMKLNEENDVKAFHKIQSWKLGFVFPDTVFPALSIFPISKTFLGQWGGGRQAVEYRLSVDYYSNKRIKRNDGKAFCLDVADDVKKTITKYIKLYKDGIQNSYGTGIELQQMFEGPVSNNTVMQISGVTQIVATAYHQMNVDRIYSGTIVESDYDTFFDKAVELLKKECSDENYGVKTWATKTTKTILNTPAILVLPDNESIEYELSNGYVIVNRPITVHVLSKGFPKSSVLKRNISLADNIVKAIEKNYMLDGYAQRCDVTSIDYNSFKEEGFSFAATINVVYQSRIRYNAVYE